MSIRIEPQDCTRLTQKRIYERSNNDIGKKRLDVKRRIWCDLCDLVVIKSK